MQIKKEREGGYVTGLQITNASIEFIPDTTVHAGCVAVLKKPNNQLAECEIEKYNSTNSKIIVGKLCFLGFSSVLWLLQIFVPPTATITTVGVVYCETNCSVNFSTTSTNKEPNSSEHKIRRPPCTDGQQQ
ncbi:hypothetical protein Tsp_05659 [Trichinella spiralis]|uniref:hypothetical protein n=1 Tax=Trichinella spiralis TaxID=6334 RepID=UPI0001EFE52D|nr:hypothetical protein Tsp_05659 [Trichinella spiralis]